MKPKKERIEVVGWNDGPACDDAQWLVWGQSLVPPYTQIKECESADSAVNNHEVIASEQEKQHSCLL